MQTRCVKLLNTYLMAFLPTPGQKDAAGEHMKALRERETELHQVFVRFLVGLENADKEVRVSTFFALSTLATLLRQLGSGAATSASTSALLAKFLGAIAANKAEFINDTTFLRRLFARLLSGKAVAAAAADSKSASSSSSRMRSMSVHNSHILLLKCF